MNMSIVKPTLKQIKEITSDPIPGVDSTVIDSMAIPSFLHWNPVIRKLVWQRYVEIAKLCNFLSGEEILEFGCGAGLFFPEIHSNHCTITGVDIYPQFANRLCSKLNIPANVHENFSRVNSNSVDTVIASEVFEHLDNPESHINSIQRVLKQDGKLIISLPTENALYKLGKTIAGFRKKEDYHVSTLHDVLGFFDKSGFSLECRVSIPNSIFPLYKVFRYNINNE